MSLGASAQLFLSREREHAEGGEGPAERVAGADDPALPGCRAEDEDGEPPLLEPFTRRDVDLADIELQSRVFVLLVLIVGMSVFAMAAASYVGIRPEIGAIAGAAAAILSPRRKPK